MDWDRLKVFHHVAAAGSFTGAGQRLGLSQPAASRQVRALEEELGVSLFTRHARGIVLTQEGKDLLETTRTVMRTLEDAERRLQESQFKPAGQLRVNTVVTFGSVWLSRHLTSFLDTYPDINVELLLTDEWLDLSAGEADVAIRLGDPGPPDLIHRPLATFHAHVYASRDYLDRHGTPASPEELASHQLIAFSAAGGPLKGVSPLRDIVPAGANGTARLQVNNLYGVLHAVEAGVGVATLPGYLTHNRDNLVRLFPDWAGASYESYYCYPPELKGSLRVDLFRDFLLSQIRAETAIL